MKSCSVCNRIIESEEPAILTMGRFANPRYLCDECNARFELAMRSHDYHEIMDALDRIGKDLAQNNGDDMAAVEAAKSIMLPAKDRAEKIREGTYDFSLDDIEDEENYEIPEELAETEEDRELDRKDRESEKKMDRILNWAWLGIGIAFVGYLVYMIFFR